MIDISFLKLREYNKTDVDGAMHPLNFLRTNCKLLEIFLFRSISSDNRSNGMRYMYRVLCSEVKSFSFRDEALKSEKNGCAPILNLSVFRPSGHQR